MSIRSSPLSQRANNESHANVVELIFREFAQSLSADRGRLPRRRLEPICRGCFRHLQGAQWELFRPSTQVAFANRDPVPPSSGISPSSMERQSVLRTSPVEIIWLRTSVAARDFARPAPRSSAVSPFPLLRFHEGFFLWGGSHPS
jgi:hypothetical protein